MFSIINILYTFFGNRHNNVIVQLTLISASLFINFGNKIFLTSFLTYIFFSPTSFYLKNLEFRICFTSRMMLRNVFFCYIFYHVNFLFLESTGIQQQQQHRKCKLNQEIFLKTFSFSVI